MSDTDATKRCERCATEFTASSPLGLCPSCLFKLGMSDPAMTPPPAQEPEAAVVSAPTPPPRAASVRRLHLPSRRVGIAIAALVAAGSGALAFALFLRPAHESSAHADPVRFRLNLPDGTAMPDHAQFAVSGDGSQVVVVARRHDGGMPGLWLRRLQSLEWRELARTDGASFPFWSPDGRHIGFFAGARLKRIDIGNDLVETLCEVDHGGGGTWSIHGVIVFAGPGGLFRVPASGGAPQPVTRLEPGRRETAHLRPQFLPDGRHFIFLTQGVNDRSTTSIADLETGEIMAIADGRGPAVFAGDRLLLSRGSVLSAQQFDYARRRLIDEARTIAGVEDIANDLRRGSGFAASSTVLVYQRQEPWRRRLLWFDREGRMIGLEGEFADADGFALSPDGRTVAVARREAGGNTSSIWLMESQSARVSRLTWGQGRDESPVWSPDGARLAFSSRRDDNQGVHIIVRDLNGREETIFSGPDARPTDWSRDGRFLIYSARSPMTRSDVWMLPVTGDKKPVQLDPTPGNQSQGVLSPDVRWLAYISDESGRDEVYVRAFPPADGRWQISTGGGTRPRWRDDGRELLFLSPDGHLMAAGVELSVVPRFGVPQRLFPVPEADDFSVRGSRVLTQTPIERAGDRQLEVILNWAAELRR